MVISDYIQRVPALRAFWDLDKTVLHEICVGGIVQENPPLAHTYSRVQNSIENFVFSTYMAILTQVWQP